MARIFGALLLLGLAAPAHAAWLDTDTATWQWAWAHMPAPAPMGIKGPCLPAAVRDWQALHARSIAAAIVIGRMPNNQTHAMVELPNGTPTGEGAWAATAGFEPIAELDARAYRVWSE